MQETYVQVVKDEDSVRIVLTVIPDPAQQELLASIITDFLLGTKTKPN